MTDVLPLGRAARTRAVALLCAAAVLGALFVAQDSAAAVRAKVPAQVTLTGAGWGHGVGLSQYGAYGMALAGYTASDIVRHYYSGTTVAAVRDDSRIRVNLLHGPNKVTMRTEAVETGGGRFRVKVKGAADVMLGAGDRLKLVRRGDGVRVVARPAAGGRKVLGVGAVVAVRWAGTDRPGGTGARATDLDVATTMGGLNTPGHRYRDGFVKVWPSSGSAGLETVNLVKVSDYLLGIAEVPSSWPAAALEAQVLAARSYALSKLAIGVRGNCRCHVDDGGGPYYDQTFVGTAKVLGASGSRWAAAVRATAPTATTGLAVLYAGKPITAFYSSSSGGRTQASVDVWGGSLPYAASVDDHWALEPAVKNPYASWRRVATQAAVAKLFGLPDVVSLDLTDVTAGDALATVTATSSTDTTATIAGSRFASGLGLPSRWVTKASFSD